MATPLTLQNEGGIDRTIRVVFGLALIALAFTGPHTPLGWLGILPLVTGAFGFCPVYRLFGISTCPTRAQ